LVKLDLVKAFDSVWTQGLLYKIIIFNFPLYLIKFLQSYLTGRSFSVNIAGTASSSKLLVAGLPQAAVLSPILFILYTADMPRLPHVKLALFSDDTAVFTQSWRPDTISRRLTHAVGRLITYFTRWRLKVNIPKTEAIIFTRRRPHPPAYIRLDGMEIP
jgi:hypothetical protein